MRDNIRNQLSELVKQKPRNKEDDDLISEMTRLEAMLQVARDDLVRHAAVGDCTYCSFSHLRSLQSACNHKLQGIKDELKHIDKSLKQNTPEHSKVL
jgi:structural maintenance of chromosome 1